MTVYVYGGLHKSAFTVCHCFVSKNKLCNVREAYFKKHQEPQSELTLTTLGSFFFEELDPPLCSLCHLKIKDPSSKLMQQSETGIVGRLLEVIQILI